MATFALPAWASAFQHVFWTEHCSILSNSSSTVIPPLGSGLDDEGDRPFHLSLLHHRVWGRDDFWYLCFLPRELSFEHDPLFHPLAAEFDRLPIQRGEDGRWKMKSDLVIVWLRLEWHVVATYNVLKEDFGGLVPLRTKLPPCPRSTGFWSTHATEDEARRAAHRARRYFHPWLCLLTMCIARSGPGPVLGPSIWFKALASYRPSFDPFWLDNIESSPILTCFDSTMPRRGLIVNMVPNWTFLNGFPFRYLTCMPMWLCFPHGAQLSKGLACSLKPSKNAVELAKLQKDRVPIDRVHFHPPPLRHENHYGDKSSLLDDHSERPVPCRDDVLDLEEGVRMDDITLETVLDVSTQPAIIELPPERLAELDRLVFSARFMDSFVDVLRFRYGMTIPVSLEHVSDILPREARSPSLLRCLRGMVHEKAIDDAEWQCPVLVDTLERFADMVFEGGVVPSDISDCHVSEEWFLNRNDIWKLRPFRVYRDGPPFYAFHVQDGTGSGRVVAVKDELTVREVLRRRWGPLHMDVVQPLAERGVPLVVGYVVPPTTLAIPLSHSANIFRPEGYCFQYLDYLSYVRRRLALFRDVSVAEPAVREGGILWRLALESQVDLGVCHGLDSDTPAYGLNTLKLGDTQWSVRIVPSSVGDSLVGMYKIYTGMPKSMGAPPARWFAYALV